MPHLRANEEAQRFSRFICERLGVKSQQELDAFLAKACKAGLN
jgi:hypothetical protein